MSVVTVIARTGLQDNLAQGGNNCKFYRTYEIPTIGALFQWGKALNGMRGGQFQLKSSPAEARAQINKKLSSGYESVSPDVTFPLDLDKLVQRGGIDSAAGRDFIDNLFQAAAASVRQSTNTPTAAPLSNPVKTAAITDRLDLLSAQVLDAINIAAGGDPIGGLQVAAKVRDDLALVEEDLDKVRSYLSTLDTLLEVS